MYKKIISSMVIVITVILGTIFISASVDDKKSEPKLGELDFERIQKEYESGKLTKEQVLTRYPNIFEIVKVSGKAVHYRFRLKVDSAEVSILEKPSLLPVKTDEDGNWHMEILKRKGKKIECSFVIKHPLYPITQTAVINVCDDNVLDVTFQIPDNQTFSILKAGVEEGISKKIGTTYKIDTDNTCQVFTTIGKSWASMLCPVFPHGEPDAQAVISPSLKFPALGPIYFNKDVVPDPTLDKTSVDGGVFYANVPDGIYTIIGIKDNVNFKTVKIKARPGILLNASPPYGVQSDQQ